jgi:hypothetical protein
MLNFLCVNKVPSKVGIKHLSFACDRYKKRVYYVLMGS